MNIAISMSKVSKYYKLYNSPADRLKEALNLFGRKYHKEFYATNNVDLVVKKGEILGVVGKNGCGKSTLLKLISGVLIPTQGTVSVNGRVSALLELGAGLNPEYTGVENIYFYGAILGFTKKEMDNKLNEIIAFADIGDFIHQKLKIYSSGMKSRLGFALAVSVNPDILIVDEVLAVGDLLFQRKCYNKINQLFNDGKTVIFVSHSSQAIAQFCKRAILLEDGAIVSDGKPKDVLALYESRLYSTTSLGEIQASDVGEKGIKSPEKSEAGKNNDMSGNLVNPEMAEFSDYRILDQDGVESSVLSRFCTYTVEYRIKYLQKIINVSHAVQIKSLRGLLISGANQWGLEQDVIESVEAGDIYKVQCSFRCLLVPGEYVVTLLVSSLSTDKLMKLEDALLFKVRSDRRVNGGIVGLDQNISANKVN